MINRFPARLRSVSIVLSALAFLVLALPAPPAKAQDQEQGTEAPKPEKLFEITNPSTLTITLTGPWDRIVREEDNKSPFPAKIEFVDSLGNANTIPLTVERRGLTRQMVCKFPPIKLRFDKEIIKNTTFRGEKSIKLVTHCDRNDKYDQFYIKEMLSYQFYNLITEASFRVQPLSVTYVDSGDGSVEGPRFGFLIEDDSDVAKRNGMKKLDAAKISPRRLEPTEASRFALFQYMVANVDFSATQGPHADECCHNARLIGLDETSDVYAVPYDFDATGFVDAPYAAPNPSLPIKKVTQRLYRGYCMHNSTLEAVRQEYLAQEQAIMSLVSNESRLNDRSMKSAQKFLQGYFDILRDPGDFQKNVIGKCR